MVKKYKAIFFDWDGTAVTSRTAPVEDASAAMKPLLQQGTKLVIVSGTTYDKIAGGKFHTYFTEEEQKNLFFGLGRGAYNYQITDGRPEIFASMIPDQEGLLKIHDICYAIHVKLLREYGLKTDIVFSRPNYCKIDLMVESDRGDQLFMQGDEVEHLRRILKQHGIESGLKELIDIAESTGGKFGQKVSATCDAKYLEVGISCKSDNVDVFLERFKAERITAEDCSFWGDEFVEIEHELYGSDSFMYTEKSKAGDFFDVSAIEGNRPEAVRVLGGGVQTFLTFLKEQA